ncbi:MAG: [protein-PII] uridylyltransferase [Rickettsiales bacterium]|nr:[protein-PII] uridylyltransferase [Rickettsiales bacterium]
MTRLAPLVQPDLWPDCPPLPKKATQPEIVARLRPWLAEQKQRIKDRFMQDAAARELLMHHSAVIDAVIKCLHAHYAGPQSKLVVAAVGGYGRCKLFPYSDIDLVFLHDGIDRAAGTVAEQILYVLWDLGLTVGQSHRSVDEAIEHSNLDMTVRSNLLDARFLAGNQAVFDLFTTRFESEIMEGTEMEFVEAKLAERDQRHKRYGDSRYMLEPNVKEGKGGLRDLHTLWWLVRYVYPIRELEDMVPMQLLTPEEFSNFDQARKFLYRVRIYLHYQEDRAEERLTFERQHALAVAMGFEHPSMNQAIIRFMKRYFVAVRTVGATTRIFCALLEDQHKRRPRKALAALWHTPWKLGGFRLDGERLNLRSHQSFEYHPLLMLELFRISQMHELDIHPHALQMIGRNLALIDDRLRRDHAANTIFLDILLSEHNPEITLRRMSEAGVLGRFMPDFGRVVGLTQFNMYHIYTVDEHTLVALGILHGIEEGEYKEELPLATELIDRIAMRRALYVALFCHDIAQGRGGDHSELGEKVVAKFAERLGLSDDEVQTAAWLVRYHLLFSNTAFKRDVNDPKTVQDFVAKVQSPERLRLLYVLTVADMRAVSAAVWNAWKASLLADLYKRAEQLMGTGNVIVHAPKTGQIKESLRKQLPGWDDVSLDLYTEQCSASLLAACDTHQHAIIARMLREAQSAPQPLLIDTQHDYERSITEIIVCATDHSGLFSKISGAMALAGANIINAKIFTLKNGMALDIFQLQDTTGDVFDRPDRLAKMSVYIEQALTGELDIVKALAERRSSYNVDSRDSMSGVGQVFIENNASNIYTVIEITAKDRSGFLYEITDAMVALGLTIATAHIYTYGTQVADVFYVKDVFGLKLNHDAKIRQVRDALLKVVNNRKAA